MRRQSTENPFINRNSPQAANLLAWLPGYPSGGAVFDWGGRCLNGVRDAGATWATGVDGDKTAILCSGTTGRVLLLRSNLVFNVTRDAISLSLWVNTSNIGNFNYLCVNWGTAGGSDSFHLRLEATTGFPYFTYSSDGNYTPANDLTGTANCADGKWHHIVATRGNGTSKIYVDGRLNVTVSVAGAIFGLSGSLVALGGLSDGNLTGNWLNGRLDDVRIYGYAIPAGLVAAMYAPETRRQLHYVPFLKASLGSGDQFAPAFAAAFAKSPGPVIQPKRVVAY